MSTSPSTLPLSVPFNFIKSLGVTSMHSSILLVTNSHYILIRSKIGIHKQKVFFSIVLDLDIKEKLNVKQALAHKGRKKSMRAEFDAFVKNHNGFWYLCINMERLL